MRQAERGQGWEHGELKHGHTSACKTHAFHTTFLSRVRVFTSYVNGGVFVLFPSLFRIKDGTCVARDVGTVELRPWSSPSPKPQRASLLECTVKGTALVGLTHSISSLDEPRAFSGFVLSGNAAVREHGASLKQGRIP